MAEVAEVKNVELVKLPVKQQKKVKPQGFGANSPAVKNDRVRHSLNNFTNGD